MMELGLDSLPEAFDKCLEFWHGDPADYRPSCLRVNDTAVDLAYRNYLLWHEEDKARRIDVSDGMIAEVKRCIDKLNQQRNDTIEKLDEEIFRWLTDKNIIATSREINSETPGSIVDRLSILSLKKYHMHEDMLRSDISDGHRQRSAQRLEILTHQRDDLYEALKRLFDDYLAGEKVMKLYKQFKMYNDPELNPELYKRNKS